MKKNENKRSVTLGRKEFRRVTSVNLSRRHWDALETIALARGLKRNRLIEIIDEGRPAEGTKLSQALRKFIFDQSFKTGERALRQFADDQTAKTAASLGDAA